MGFGLFGKKEVRNGFVFRFCGCGCHYIYIFSQFERTGHFAGMNSAAMGVVLATASNTLVKGGHDLFVCFQSRKDVYFSPCSLCY